jgi:hypothetical protein
MGECKEIRLADINTEECNEWSGLVLSCRLKFALCLFWRMGGSADAETWATQTVCELDRSCTLLLWMGSRVCLCSGRGQVSAPISRFSLILISLLWILFSPFSTASLLGWVIIIGRAYCIFGSVKSWLILMPVYNKISILDKKFAQFACLTRSVAWSNGYDISFTIWTCSEMVLSSILSATKFFHYCFPFLKGFFLSYPLVWKLGCDIPLPADREWSAKFVTPNMQLVQKSGDSRI